MVNFTVNKDFSYFKGKSDFCQEVVSSKVLMKKKNEENLLSFKPQNQKSCSKMTYLL